MQSKGLTFRQIGMSRNQSSIDFQDIQEINDDKKSDKKDVSLFLT